MRCDQCGHENAARDRFCGKCGRPLAAAPHPTGPSPQAPAPQAPAPQASAPHPTGHAAQAQPPPPQPARPQPAPAGRGWWSRGLLALGLAVGAIVILIGAVLVVVFARDPILDLIGRSGGDGREEGVAGDIPTLTSIPTRELEPTATAPPPTATVAPEPTAPPPTATPEPGSDLKDAIVGRWSYECDVVSDLDCFFDMLIVFTNNDKVFYIEFVGEEENVVDVYPYSVKGDEITMQIPAEEGGPGVWRVIEVDEEMLVIEVAEDQGTYSLVRDKQEVPDSLRDGILGSWMASATDTEIPVVIYEFAADGTLNIYLIEPPMLLCRGAFSLPTADAFHMSAACLDQETGEFGDVAFVIYEDGLFINEFQFVIFKEPPGQFIFTRVDDWSQ